METGMFSLDDFDCIGFDLDCTLAEYNVREVVKLTYNLLVEYLVENKSYDKELLQKSFEEGEYFLQKGLFLDLKKGNVLKLSENGVILRATHGTTCLNLDEIVKQYGLSKTLSVNLAEVIKDPSLFMKISDYRSILDCFDMACVLIFARIVDLLDSKHGEIATEYNIWPDIVAGLNKMYDKNHFATGESKFFSALRNSPSLYYKKWTPEKLAWLKDIKSKKFLYVLTGSYMDFAELTASYCIGENWKDYFDVVLCYGKKPHFFFANRPFFNVKDLKETEAVKEEDLQINTIYSQGNWEKLKNLISKQVNIKEPKCLYVGDNVFLDVYSPVHFKCCHAVAISFELNDEFKLSKVWGSFFKEDDNQTTFWNNVIQQYAMISVASLDIFIRKPLNHQYICLKQSETNEGGQINGYYIN